MKERKPRYFLRLAVFLSAFIGISLFLVLAALGVIIYLNSPPAAPAEITAFEFDGLRSGEAGEYFIEVRKGETAQSVGQRLEQAGLIRNRYFWYWLCRLSRDFIKSGTYRLEIPANQMAIHRILVSGKQLLIRVTIPEGATLKKTAAILEDSGICLSQEFLEAAMDPVIVGSYRIPNSSMEGYLFPDTYLFPENYPADRTLHSMADNFFKRIRELDATVQNISPEELNRIVIIASIIEREYRINEEAPLMAGVFFNRLRIGMALQSCATVEYVITEIQGRPRPEVLYNRDLEIRDPYNTYFVPGLPPGPISSPGKIALNAAFNPAKTDYLYFRLNDVSSGKHYFSKTLDEHIRAGQLLLKSQP